MESYNLHCFCVWSLLVHILYVRLIYGVTYVQWFVLLDVKHSIPLNEHAIICLLIPLLMNIGLFPIQAMNKTAMNILAQVISYVYTLISLGMHP